MLLPIQGKRPKGASGATVLTKVPAYGSGRLAVPSLNCIIAVQLNNTIGKNLKGLLLCELMFVCANLCQSGFRRGLLVRYPDAVQGDKFNIAHTFTSNRLSLTFNLLSNVRWLANSLDSAGLRLSVAGSIIEHC